MILELLTGVGLVVAGAATARLLTRRRTPEDRAIEDEDEAKKDEKPKRNKKPEKASDEEPPRKRPRFRGRRKKKEPVQTGPRGLLVGDVLLYEDTELWLAGVIELEEEGFVARLFPTPGALRSEWVGQLDEEARDIATLSETEEVPDGPVPEALPIDGRRLTLERRGHAELKSDGENLPRIGHKGRYTLLSDAGGRVLFVVDFDKAPRIALSGERVAKHMIDLLPGGDLED